MTVLTVEVRLHLPAGEEDRAVRIAAAWTQIAALPAYDQGRLEFEAQLHLFLARLAWRDADRARDRDRRRARR